MAVTFQQLPLAITANSDNRFNTFFTTQTHAQVVVALKALAASEGDAFVYLWGASGSGVSHLLNAVQCATSLSVQNLPLSLLGDYSPDDIFDGLEQLDLICIDDLQLIAGNADWEQALFHLFNRLRDSGKRLLIGSRLSPREIPVQLPDLQSRLQWCSVYQLQPLGDEEKRQALQFCADRSGLVLTDDVANYLLSRGNRSPGFLFQLMQQLDKASLAEQRRLTIPFVKRVLADFKEG